MTKKTVRNEERRKDKIEKVNKQKNEQTEEVKEEERGRKGEGTGRMGKLFNVYGGCKITFGIWKKKKKCLRGLRVSAPTEHSL